MPPDKRNGPDEALGRIPEARDGDASHSSLHSAPVTRLPSNDPVPLADTVRELFERLHVADMQAQLRKEAWLNGYACGERVHAGDYDKGWADAIAYIKGDQHAIVGSLRGRPVRWVVRGQERTRQTFADPHPADFPGGAA